MCIVFEEGIHQLNVEFCACLSPQILAAKPDGVQLIKHSFWAASWTQPLTAFAIKSLKSLSLPANRAQVKSYDYFNILRRKTDNVIRHDVLMGASQDGDKPNCTEACLGRIATESLWQLLEHHFCQAAWQTATKPGIRLTGGSLSSAPPTGHEHGPWVAWQSGRSEVRLNSIVLSHALTKRGHVS